jgi:dihydroorotate dehydrogenase
VSLKKPWLLFSAEVAYSLSHYFLKIYNCLGIKTSFPWGSITWRNLHFKNPLGTSGGVDKNAEYIKAWWAFGAGFIEIGTVTPKAQTPNPGKIIKRDNAQFALWNKMGFPNEGVQAVKKRLAQLGRPYHTPIFVNIGKNRETPNEKASDDYLYCVRELREYADVFVVNISSPNTTGLRELLTPKHLTSFLQPILAECRGQTPVLLKLSPDISDDILKQTLETSAQIGIDGWILSNTTIHRDNVQNMPTEGGVSGLPIAERAKSMLRIASEFCRTRKLDKLIVSSGGVLTPADVAERLRLGAQLVQIYSALVFEGPGFFCKVSAAANKDCKS